MASGGNSHAWATRRLQQGWRAAEQVEAGRRVGDVVAERVAEHPLEPAEAQLGHPGQHVGEDRHQGGQADRSAVRGVDGRPVTTDRAAPSTSTSALGAKPTISTWRTIRFSKCSSCPHELR